MKKNVLFIARVGMLLALAIIFQNLRAVIPLLPIPVLGNGQTIIIGSLVNLMLYVATATTGIWGGAVISIATPLVALLQGHLPFPQMMPVVAAGNLVLVLIFYFFANKNAGMKIVGVALASVVKMAVLWGLVGFVISPFLPEILSGKPDNAIINVRNTLLAGFSWPQLITAILGGMLALAIIPVIKKAIKEE